MSIKTTTAIEVEVEGVEVNTQPNEDIVTTTTHHVEIEDQESIVEGIKREYSVIGDGLYASINVDEAPEWLTTIIDSVVSNAVSSGMVDYDNLVQDVRSAIEALDVAKNTYVEQINFDASVDAIIASRLVTLNATLENTYATIVDLETAAVNADEALTQRASDIEAAYTSEINSRITSVETAFTNADSAIASDVSVLSTAFDDQESNLSGVADAVTSIQTYVGIDAAGASTHTNLSAYLEDDNGVIGGGESEVANSIYTNGLGDAVSKFEYGSALYKDGNYYTAGFGLNLSTASGTGSDVDPYDSEFWINAEKFKFTNTSLSGTVTPFSIDASGATPQITFNGIVSFENTDMSAYEGSGVNTMIDDGVLSASEKGLWRADWPGMMSEYDIFIIRATELGVSSGTEYDELILRKTNLENYLVAAGVWSAPEDDYAITGTELQDAVALYNAACQVFFNRILVQGPIEDNNAVAVDALTRISDFDNFVVNYNDRNDLNSTTPADPVVLAAGLGTTHETNPDGSCNIFLKWEFTGTGDAYDIDGFVIYMYKTDGDIAYTFETDKDKEGVFYFDSTRREFALLNMSSLKNFVFGVQAYRVVDNTVSAEGILKSGIVTFNTSLPNTYFTSIDIPSPTNVQIAII